MLKLNDEIKTLRLENANLRSENAKLKKELETMRLNVVIVRDSREKIEVELAEVVTELRELRGGGSEPSTAPPPPHTVESPILDRKITEHHQQKVQFAEKPKKFVDEDVIHEDCGRTDNTDFRSTWKRNIQIVKADRNSVVLANNHHSMPQRLDEYILSRLVDGNNTITPTLVPLGIEIQPGRQFTIYANVREARQIPGVCCIMHRFPTFGDGKVSMTELLDENGDKTATYQFTQLY